jgi:hypothetical protein
MYTQGKPDQHATCIPHSVHVWSLTIHISCGQRIATFCEVINSDGQSHCSQEKGLRHNSQHDSWRIHGSVSSFSPKTTIESVGVKPPSIDGNLLGLPDPYFRYAVSKFNTCSRGPTHRSLTDTDGATILKALAFYITFPDLPNRWCFAFHLRAPSDLGLSNINISL